MTSNPSAHISASWPVAAAADAATAEVVAAPVTLAATAPLGAVSLICDSLRVLSAFSFRNRPSRKQSAQMCELLDRMN